MPKDRARAIVTGEGAVLLIERRRNGELYWVFPGGGIERGETPEAAAIREIREETGLRVVIDHLVAIEPSNGKLQYFYTASVLGGQLGSGDGAEMSATELDPSGSYQPVWVPLETVPHLPVYPIAMAQLLIDAMRRGWPDEAVLLPDSGWKPPSRKRSTF